MTSPTIAVADTGVGIPARYLPRLYDEFFRGHHGGERVNGTGLGLPICRRIAQELGAIIEVESEEGVGSTFRVRIPTDPNGKRMPLPSPEG